MRLSLLLAIALPVVTAQLLGTGQACMSNTECDSRLCNVPPLGPGDRQCLSRPSYRGSSCDKALETTDCETGYCNAETSTCADRPDTTTPTTPSTGACTDDASCGTNRVCNEGTCLDGLLGEGQTCVVDKQCDQYDRNPTCKQGKCTKPLFVGEPCQDDRQCITGVCDLHTVDGSAQRLCLASAGQPDGAQCDVDRSCASFYCAPAKSGSTDRACGTKPDNSGSESSSSSSSSASAPGSEPSDNGGGGGGGDVSSSTNPNSNGNSQPTAVVSGSRGSGGISPSSVAPDRTVVTSVSIGQTIRSTSRRASAAASASASPSGAAEGLKVTAGGWLVALLAAVLALFV